MMMLTVHQGICTADIGAICLRAAGCGNDHSADRALMAPVYSVEGNALVLEGDTYEDEVGTASLLTKRQATSTVMLSVTRLMNPYQKGICFAPGT